MFKKYLTIQNCVLLLVFLCSCYLLLHNLDNQYLWQDEAETALISQTIFNHGIPKGTDGINFFSQMEGKDFDEGYTAKMQSWFQFYFQALFFGLFGVSTFTARLPFALLGIATIIITFFLAFSLWKDNRTAFVCTLLLMLSVPFLLLAKQSRYYSASMIFTVYFFICYLHFLKGKKWSYYHLVISGFFLFHNQYLSCFTLFLTVNFHTLLFYKQKMKTIVLLSIITGILIFPYLLWMSGSEYANIYQLSAFTVKNFVSNISSYLKDFANHIFPIYVLIIPVGFLIYNMIKKKPIIFKNIDKWQNITLLLLFILINILTLSVITIEYYFRYLSSLIPVSALLVGRILMETRKIHSVVPVLGIAFLVIFSPIDQYLFELNHNFRGPIKGIVKYLKKYSKPDETIAITYGDLPLKFYTKNKIYGGLTGEDLTDAVNADWIIIRKNIICIMDYKVMKFLTNNVDFDNYEKHILQYPDTPFENRESPNEHYYKTVRNADPVILFHKRKE